ncbi:MAG: hypothetical protein EOO52_12930 [Gammaproteobacteria bacterium]|nr:MAG: hypothetical protein EOO52_12930 [Gammaproteobacteria bacterium]
MTNVSKDRKFVTRKSMTIKACTVTGFADEVDFSRYELIEFRKTRVSRIVPLRRPLRYAFFCIRALVADESYLAKWTRTWGCIWTVVIEHKIYGPFNTRNEAIDFEKEKLRGVTYEHHF